MLMITNESPTRAISPTELTRNPCRGLGFESADVMYRVLDMKLPRVRPVMIGMTKTLVMIIRRAPTAGIVGVEPMTERKIAAKRTPKFQMKFINHAKNREFCVAISYPSGSPAVLNFGFFARAARGAFATFAALTGFAIALAFCGIALATAFFATAFLAAALLGTSFVSLPAVFALSSSPIVVTHRCTVRQWRCKFGNSQKQQRH